MLIIDNFIISDIYWWQPTVIKSTQTWFQDTDLSTFSDLHFIFQLQSVLAKTLMNLRCTWCFLISSHYNWILEHLLLLNHLLLFICKYLICNYFIVITYHYFLVVLILLFFVLFIVKDTGNFTKLILLCLTNHIWCTQMS